MFTYFFLFPIFFFFTSKISLFRLNRGIAIQDVAAHFNPQPVSGDTVLKYSFRREVEILKVLHLSTFLPLCLCLLGFPGQVQPRLHPSLLSQLTGSDTPLPGSAVQASSPSPRPWTWPVCRSHQRGSGRLPCAHLLWSAFRCLSHYCLSEATLKLSTSGQKWTYFKFSQKTLKTS